MNAQDDIQIIKKPLGYSAKRTQLSLEYMKEHYLIVQQNPTINPKIIVLHYTAGGTVESNFQYFNKPYLEDKRSYLKNESTLNVASHFIIDRDGTIYQLLEPTQFARHTIGLNYCAIGIENTGSKENPLTNEQVIANAKLIMYLTKKYAIEYVIGHSEYGVFRNSEWWKETNAKYYTEKEDPGNEFMQKVRTLIKDLNLKSKP
jgi:N-acetyl-anhydromuramyl-L-alanine amidase AmpD